MWCIARKMGYQMACLEAQDLDHRLGTITRQLLAHVLSIHGEICRACGQQPLMFFDINVIAIMTMSFFISWLQRPQEEVQQRNLE